MASAPPSDQPPPLPANDGRKRQQGGAQRTRRDGRAAFCAPTAPPSAPAGASGRTRRKGEEGARANAARRAHTEMCGEDGNAAAATTSAAAGASPPIGASANVVGTSVSAKCGYPISWGRYCKYCVPATILVMLVSTAYLFLRYL